MFEGWKRGLEGRQLSRDIEELLSFPEVDIEKGRKLAQRITEELSAVGEYAEEQTMATIESAVRSVPDIDHDKVLEEIILTDPLSGKKRLSASWKKTLQQQLNPDASKKGEREHETLDDLHEIHGYLFLSLLGNEAISEEVQKTLQGGFESLLFEREKEFLRLRTKFEPLTDLRKRLESLLEGDAVTFTFSQKLFDQLPEEIKNNPEQFGITKGGDGYQFSLDSEKATQYVETMIERHIDLAKIEREINELIPEAQEVLNKAKKALGKEIYVSLMTGLNTLTEAYRQAKIQGASKEELEKIRDGIQAYIQKIKEMVGITEQEGDEEKKKNMLLEKVKEIGKVIWGAMPQILGGLALGGALWVTFTAIYLPVYLMDKVEKSVGKKFF